MHEPRLFRAPHAGVVIQAQHVPAERGWRLIVRLRRDDESWDAGYRADYSHLTTDELVDVLHAELGQL